jgi:hypothetical protein
MFKQNTAALSVLQTGAREGIAAGVRDAFAGVTAEPLPIQLVELLLALRRYEREARGRQGQ